MIKSTRIWVSTDFLWKCIYFAVLLVTCILFLRWTSEAASGKRKIMMGKDANVFQINPTTEKQEREEAFIDEETLLTSLGGERRKVVIGAVSCRNGTATKENMKYNEATLVMIKSVLISAKLYNISTVELHLFLEWKEDEDYFVQKLQEMGYPNDDDNLVLITHSAVDVAPKEHRDHMIYHPRFRCGYVRFFFPSALPNVDSIMHIDSDMIITGDLWELWTRSSLFKDEQLIGASRSNEANDTHYLKMYQRWFGDIPHPPPKGINAGLLIMNLTRMRNIEWEKRFVRIYEDYSKIVNLTGQRTVNILMANDPGILQQLSCKYSFCHRHCDKEFTCLDAADTSGSSGGVYLVHGNGHQLDKEGVFYPIFTAYQKFNMSTLNEGMPAIKAMLMTPIRKYYANRNCMKCFGTLNHLLFLDFYKKEDANFTLKF